MQEILSFRFEEYHIVTIYQWLTVKCSAELKSSSKNTRILLKSLSCSDSHKFLIKSWTYSIDFSYVFPPTSCKWRATKSGFRRLIIARNSSIHGLSSRSGWNETKEYFMKTQFLCICITYILIYIFQPNCCTEIFCSWNI